MRPLGRKLRLRKSTIRDLTPDQALGALGGAKKPGEDESEGILCTFLCSVRCTNTCTCDTACETLAFSNCPGCLSWDCPPQTVQEDCYSVYAPCDSYFPGQC